MRNPSAARRLQPLAVALCALLALAGRCGGGSGGGGGAPVVRIEAVDARCLPLAGPFPVGLSALPGAPARAAVGLFDPPAAFAVDLDREPPRIVAPSPVPSFPADSDGDGEDDVAEQLAAGLPFASAASPSAIEGVDPQLALVTASGYEEVLFVDPTTGSLVPVEVSVPAGWPPERAPFLPPPGTRAMRTALSTLRCVDAPAASRDSNGRTLAPSCDPAQPSFLTHFTSAAAVAAGRLFVATSNFARVGSNPINHPGTILVHSFDTGSSPIRVEPDPTSPVLYTSAFNPTALAPTRTPGGHEVVLVTETGVVGIATGPSVALSTGAIEVIDAENPRMVATVPLGRSAPSGLAVDPSGRLAAAGSLGGRSLAIVDLAPLDAALAAHVPGTPPIVLDGSDPRLPFDARIFDAATPLTFPGRPAGGAPDDACAGLVFDVAFSASGSKLFAIDFCDGLLGIFAVDLVGAPSGVPLARNRIRLLGTRELTVPNDPARFPSEPKAPTALLVRLGVPGVDFRGPDLYFLAGLPEGSLCGVRIDSF